MMAAALVKPTMTGCERKLTIAPRRNTPNVSCIAPTMNASATASMMYCSAPGAANCTRVEPVRIETMATGPVASWLEEPHKAPTSTGRKAAYRP